MTTVIDSKKCTGCGLCVSVCPRRTIRLENNKAVVGENGSIGCGHCQAACPVGAIRVSTLDQEFSLEPRSGKDPWLAPGQFPVDELVRLMRSRRSCRNYIEQPVDPALLDRLVKIGITAPSGTNSQCWTFTTIATRSDVKTLGVEILGYFEQLNRLAEKGWLRGLGRLFGKDRLGEYYRNHYPTVQKGLDAWHLKKEDRLFHNATAALIIGSEPGASCPADDALLATQNILLAAHAMGLGTCLIGFAVHAIKNKKGLKARLGIPTNEDVHSVIALGHTRERYHRPAGRKKPLVRSPSLAGG